MSAPRRLPRLLSPAGLLLAGLLMAGLLMAGARPVAAADLDGAGFDGTVSQGASCDAPEVQGFPGVWRGHFTGGASAYPGPGSSIFLDWRDEKRCFASRRSCDRWIGEMRRDFHHPEGYYTCLAIR